MDYDDVIDPKTNRLRTDLIVIGNRLYRKCPTCYKMVRINKPFLGDLHLCSVKA